MAARKGRSLSGYAVAQRGCARVFCFIKIQFDGRLFTFWSRGARGSAPILARRPDCEGRRQKTNANMPLFARLFTLHASDPCLLRRVGLNRVPWYAPN